MARTAIHPGEHLAEEFKELGISAAALARQIDVPVMPSIAVMISCRIGAILRVSRIRALPTFQCHPATSDASCHES